MNGQPDIADGELKRFKNFDALLNRHFRILNERKPVTWKVVTPVLTLVGLVVLYLVLSENDLKPFENHALPVDSVVLLDKEDSLKIQTQSVRPGKKRSEVPKHEKPNAVRTEVQNSQSSVKQKVDSVINMESELAATPAAQTDSIQTNPPKTEVVYVQAEPIDGYEALYAYFNKELIYPEAAVKDSIEGVLIVKFLINKEGKPERIETSGTLGILFDKEAARLIEHMPLWKPATVNGKPIASKLSVPLTFQLHNKK